MEKKNHDFEELCCMYSMTNQVHETNEQEAGIIGYNNMFQRIYKSALARFLISLLTGIKVHIVLTIPLS